jgi:hypothetical protein
MSIYLSFLKFNVNLLFFIIDRQMQSKKIGVRIPFQPTIFMFMLIELVDIVLFFFFDVMLIIPLTIYCNNYKQLIVL